MSYCLTYLVSIFAKQVLNEFISDLMDDEEEVLLALADVLGQFLDFIGGPAHGIHVIKILEKLC